MHRVGRRMGVALALRRLGPRVVRLLASLGLGASRAAHALATTEFKLSARSLLARATERPRRGQPGEHALACPRRYAIHPELGAELAAHRSARTELMRRAVRAAFRSVFDAAGVLRVVRRAVLAAILAGFGVTVAGCGGSNAPTVANIGTTTASRPTTSVPNSSAAADYSGAHSGSGAKIGAPFSVTGSAQQLTRFAACIRANGEPTFPDPNAQGVISASFNRASPQFSQALQTCRKKVPGFGKG